MRRSASPSSSSPAFSRIAVVTDELHPDVRVAVPALLKSGVTRADLRFVDGQRLPAISKATVDYLRHAAEAGMRWGSLSPGMFKGSMKGTVLARELEQTLPATLLLAKELCVPRVIVFGGGRGGSRRPIFDALGEAAGMAREAGVEIVVENSSQCRVRTAQDLVSVASETGLRVVWDPGNAALSGERDLSAGARAVADHVASVHVRDWNRSGWQRMGEGIIDWRTQIDVLSSRGYAGDYCVESHRNHDPGATPANIHSLAALLEG